MPVATTEASFPLDEHHVRKVSRSLLVEASRSAPEIYQGGGVTIARVHKDAVLKYGTEVHLSEARNMHEVGTKATLRLPALYDAWEDDEEGNTHGQIVGYIYMEYVKGDRVLDMWDSLGIDARHAIHLQLAQMIQHLQHIPVVYPGPIGRDISRGLLFTDYGAGPFVSSQHLEAWFNERLLVCKQFGQVPQTEPDFSMRHLALVMCHMDISARNLILDPQGKVWLLDWAYAGGYPAYFEKAVLAKGDPDFTSGLLEMMGGDEEKEIGQLRKISFALSTAAVTRPAGYSG